MDNVRGLYQTFQGVGGYGCLAFTQWYKQNVIEKVIRSWSYNRQTSFNLSFNKSTGWTSMLGSIDLCMELAMNINLNLPSVPKILGLSCLDFRFWKFMSKHVVTEPTLTYEQLPRKGMMSYKDAVLHLWKSNRTDDLEELAYQLIVAIKQLHQRDIRHSDIQPNNIVVYINDRVDSDHWSAKNISEVAS